MKNKKLLATILIVMLVFTSLPGVALADVTPNKPDVNAPSYVVVEASNGTVLFGKNYDAQMAPASITKIMTAILAIESGKLDNEVAVPNLPEFESGAVTIHLVAGERYKLRDLVQVMLTASANDAAYTVANAVGGNVDKFVTQMNNKAESLGMTNTSFKNPTGLDEEGHVVTALDMAKLACYAMQNDTFREMVKVQQVNWVGISYEKPLATTNQLFGLMTEATGIKTGNTAAAGQTFVGSASREGRELIGVILGETDGAVFTNMKKILNYGFEHTRISNIIVKDHLETTLQVGDKRIPVVTGADYTLIRPTENATLLEYNQVLNNVQLPLKKGEQVGYVEVKSDGELLTEIPLVVTENAGKPVNWLFLVCLVLSVIYVASIISRIYFRMQKNKKRREETRKKTQEAKANADRKGKYDYLINAEHPTQQQKPSSAVQKKTLQSSRDRNKQ